MAAELRWLDFNEKKLNETLKNTSLTKQLVTIVHLAKKFDSEENGDVISSKTKVSFTKNVIRHFLGLIPL